MDKENFKTPIKKSKGRKIKCSNKIRSATCEALNYVQVKMPEKEER